MTDDKFTKKITEIKEKAKNPFYFNPHTVIIRFLLDRLKDADARICNLEEIVELYDPNNPILFDGEK